MRPTDEDQPGSRRPNLMASSRRNAGDINILAMLDGLGSRPQAKRTMLWYGGGAVLACALIGTGIWLAHEPATRLDSTMVSAPLQPAPVLATAASEPAVPERMADAAPAQPVEEPPPLASSALPAPASGATIVNVADERAPAPPPLKLEPMPAEAPRFNQTAPRPAAARHAPGPKNIHLASARGSNASVHAGPVHANPKRGAPLVKPVPAPAAVDTDVALISAIIQHAANRHDAADDKACGDKPCGPRMPARP